MGKEYQSKGRGIKKSNLPKTIQKKGYNHVLYQREFIPPNEAIQKSSEFYKMMNTRRSIRFFSNRKVPLKVIENVIQNPELKHQIRMAAEEEEKINYEGGRMNDKWQRALDKIGTDSTKEYIDIVPYIIIVFKQTHSYDEETSEKQPHYYFERSVGIACGMLITAIHQAGLCTLTHTPTPMGFLTKILDRPENEKPYLLLPVGYPADDCYVPD